MTNENKNPRKEEEEEWLRAYKSQCHVGEHSKAQMAGILGIKETTFRSNISRLDEKKIEISFSGSENCEFCVRLEMKDLENLEVNEFSTTKRKFQAIKRQMNGVTAGSNPITSTETLSSDTLLTPKRKFQAIKNLSTYSVRCQIGRS